MEYPRHQIDRNKSQAMYIIMLDKNNANNQTNLSTRICISPGTFGTGGIGQNSINLARAFIEKGHDVDFLLMGKETGSRESEVPCEANVIKVASRSRYALPGVVHYLRSYKPSLVISAHHHVNVIMLLAKWLSGLKNNCTLVCTFRTHRSIDLRNSSIHSKIYDWVAFKLYSLADELVAVSKGIADDIELNTSIPKGAVKVIYNPAWTVDSTMLSKKPCDHPWLSDKSIPVVISVGRLTRQKEFATLIKAFSKARSQKKMRLLVLGDGEDRAILLTIIQELGLSEVVDMPGHVPNPLSYMAASDLFVLSSAWEGFGNVLVEALGCGLPVVSTDCPSGPAEILDYGRYGTLVHVGDDEAMARAILKAFAIPHDPEVQKNRAKQFTEDISARKYLDLMSATK